MIINNKMNRIMIPYSGPELKLKRQVTYGTTQNKVSASQDIRETRSGKK
jgi:hypothetical protein